MVYITGDVHGDASRFFGSSVRGVKKGDTVIVCGDFGFVWDGSAKEKKLLKKLGKRPFTIAFLDGVHENYDLLEAYPVTEWNGGKARVIDGKLVHLMRGEIYTIEGQRFFVFGGGQNQEYSLRSECNTWWEREMPSEEEMKQGLARLEQENYQVEYILTHQPSGMGGGRMIRQLDGLHVYFNRIEELVTYRRWFFGCLHVDRSVGKHTAVFQQLMPCQDKDQGR